MATKRPRKRAAVEAEEASLGRARKPDQRATRSRAAVSDMLTPNELDERQTAISLTRKRGGPSLESRRRGAKAEQEDDAPDVPETPCD